MAMTITDILIEFQGLRRQALDSLDFSPVAKGYVAACDQIIIDCTKALGMKRGAKTYLRDTLACYEATWTQKDEWSKSAHATLRQATTKLRKLL